MVLNYPQIYKTNFGDASIVSHVHEWLELRQLAGLANLHTCAERCRMLASEGSGQEKEPPRRERDPFAQRVEVGWWDRSVNPVVKASFPK